MKIFSFLNNKTKNKTLLVYFHFYKWNQEVQIKKQGDSSIITKKSSNKKVVKKQEIKKGSFVVSRKNYKFIFK